jgi:hypothetical protein
MNKQKSDFPKDLERGCRYEGKFYRWYKQNSTNKITWLQEKYEADFLINDFKVELKTDFTPHTNFFMEHFSNIKTRRLGGPRQAKGYKAKFYCYWFVDELNPHQWSCYSFRTDELVAWLDIHMNRYQTRRKLNKGFVTLGHIIPIETLSKQSFCKIIRIEVK